jgi:exodeoxyribonuclease VII small subunit
MGEQRRKGAHVVDTTFSEGERHEDVAALSFEAALKELEGIVTKLERGDVALEESIAFYERGEALKRRCEALLRQAEERVEKIRLDTDGEPSTEPFDTQ